MGTGANGLAYQGYLVGMSGDGSTVVSGGNADDSVSSRHFRCFLSVCVWRETREVPLYLGGELCPCALTSRGAECEDGDNHLVSFEGGEGGLRAGRGVLRLA